MCKYSDTPPLRGGVGATDQAAETATVWGRETDTIHAAGMGWEQCQIPRRQRRTHERGTRIRSTTTSSVPFWSVTCSVDHARREGAHTQTTRMAPRAKEGCKPSRQIEGRLLRGVT